MSTAELVHLPMEAEALVMRRPPEQVIADGKRAAHAIMEIINAKPAKDKVMMNGTVFLEHEDWSTIARFFQTAPRIRSDNFCQYGEASGFEATAELVDINTGRVISTATAMCLNDEENWSLRPKYGWEDVLDENGKKIWDKAKNRYKSKRVDLGMVPTPLFQLRSMAQTRASAKVQRLVYSWVLVLAGIKISPTPAEEIGYGEIVDEGETQERKKVQRKSEQKEEKPEPQDPDCITPENINTLFTVAWKRKLSKEEVTAELQLKFKNKKGQPIHSHQEIQKKDFAACLDMIDPEFKFHAKEESPSLY